MRHAGYPSAFLIMLLAVAVLPEPARITEPNQAGLVVRLADGQVVTRCVAFEEDQVSGAELLARSGLDVTMDPSSSMGITVCRIEGTGCNFPGEPCFCQCMGGGTCIYWNYYYRDSGTTRWVYSGLGAAMRKVKPGSVDAWVWGEGDTPPAQELT